MRSRRRATTSTAGLPARPAVLVVDGHGWTSVVVHGDLDDPQVAVVSQVLEVVLRSAAARARRLRIDLQAVTSCSKAGLQLVASLVARGVAIEVRPVVAGSDSIAGAQPPEQSVAADERHDAAGMGG